MALREVRLILRRSCGPSTEQTENMRPHIPHSLATDRSVITLVSRWRNLLEEHAHCRKRVNWNVKHATQIERQRRTRRWEIEALLNEIEFSLLRLCAEATQHHEIYTRPTINGDPLAIKSFSALDVLLREYHRNRRRAGQRHLSRNDVNRARTRKRHVIVGDIVSLQWRWLSALFKAIFPTQKLPPKRKTDYRVLRPKRLKPSHEKLAI